MNTLAPSIPPTGTRATRHPSPTSALIRAQHFTRLDPITHSMSAFVSSLDGCGALDGMGLASLLLSLTATPSAGPRTMLFVNLPQYMVLYLPNDFIARQSDFKEKSCGRKDNFFIRCCLRIATLRRGYVFGSKEATTENRTAMLRRVHQYLLVTSTVEMTTTALIRRPFRRPCKSIFGREAQNGEKRFKSKVKGSLIFVFALSRIKNETKWFLFVSCLFCLFHGLYFVFHRSVSAFDDSGGGSGNVFFYLRKRILKTPKRNGRIHSDRLLQCGDAHWYGSRAVPPLSKVSRFTFDTV